MRNAINILIIVRSNRVRVYKGKIRNLGLSRIITRKSSDKNEKFICFKILINTWKTEKSNRISCKMYKITEKDFKPLTEFKVNDYIILKLGNDGKTRIFVNGEHFRQCMYLLFTVDIKNPEKYDNIKSIDDMKKKNINIFKRGLFNLGYKKHKISPEEEFKAHCSNLQAWVENDYDPRLLHSNLSFPLLRKLTELGDVKAEVILSDELYKRFLKADPYRMKFYEEEGYLDYIDSLSIYSTDLEGVFDLIRAKLDNEILRTKNYNLDWFDITFEKLVKDYTLVKVDLTEIGKEFYKFAGHKFPFSFPVKIKD